MFLLTLDKITDESILDNINTTLDDYGLSPITFIIYKPNFKEKSYNIKNIKAHFLLLDLDDLMSIYTKDEDEALDILLDLMELDLNVIIDYKDSKYRYTDVFNLFEDINFKYNEIGMRTLNKVVDIKTRNFIGTCKEIFEVDNDISFKYNQFKLKYKIDNFGNVASNKNYIGNIKETPLLQLLISNETSAELLKINDIKHEKLFTSNLYEPYAFLGTESETTIEIHIEDYKRRVFDKVKNIEPELYKDLPKEVVDLLNDNNYIKLDDIIDIINLKDIYSFQGGI